MGKLAEIESAVDELSPEEQGELPRYVAACMGMATSLVQMPEPRDIPIEQIRQWIADDGEGMRRFAKVRLR